MTTAGVGANEAASLATCLRQVLEHPGVDRLVEIYLEGPPRRSFAGAMFGELGENPSDQVTLADVAAVSLLDVRFGPRALHKLIEEGHGNAELSDVPASVELWAATSDDLAKLRVAYSKLKELPGVNRTKASKLLARKRPNLAPIVDSVVERVLETKGWRHLESLAEALAHDAELVERCRELSTGRVSPLRALDIAIWMIASQSKDARAARREANAPEWEK